MSITLAPLNTSVWLGLGKPDASVIEMDEILFVSEYPNSPKQASERI